MSILWWIPIGIGVLGAAAVGIGVLCRAVARGIDECDEYRGEIW